MKTNQMKHFIGLLCFTILMALLTTCTNQRSSKQGTPGKQASEDKQDIELEIDTTSLLKFTTGVRSILEDSKGNIWFGSHQEGVCLFDGEKLSYFTTEDGLSNNQVRSIFEDATGVVWFECGEGISKYKDNKISTPVMKNFFFKSMWQIGKDDLWFKGDEMVGYNAMEEKAGVYRYNGTTLSYHTFPIEKTENNSSLYSISTPFVRGKNRRLWFGTYGAVIGYDGIDFTIIDNENLGFDKETGFLHVRSIFEDSKGNLWIGNNGIGVLLHDGTTTINFSNTHDLLSENSQLMGGYRSPPASLEHVFAIGEDHKGNIWFGDRDTGAWKYDGQALKNYTLKDGLPVTHIWQIYRTKNDELWFAMGDGSVYSFKDEAFERRF